MTSQQEDGGGYITWKGNPVALPLPPAFLRIPNSAIYEVTAAILLFVRPPIPRTKGERLTERLLCR